MILAVILFGTCSIFIIPQIYGQQVPSLNIPPTNAFDKIYGDSGKISAINFSMPFSVKGGAGISTIANNSTHSITISNSALSTIQGTYNTTQANNVNKNTNGYQINFINGSGANVNILNSHSGRQVNVTISASGSGGTVSGSGTSPQIAYWTGTNTIGSASNFVYSSNNVGIGTVSPTARLQIATSGGGNLYASDYGCGAFGGIGGSNTLTGCTNYALLTAGADTFINRPSSFGISFREGNLDQMRIAPGGNVGIGTISPVSTLDVNGLTYIRHTGDALVMYAADSLLGNSQPVGLTFHKQNTAGTELDVGQINGYLTSNTPGSENSQMEFVTRDTGTAKIYMVLDDKGNLSIGNQGTLNIVYRCTVAGNDRIGVLTTVASDCGTAVDTHLRVQ